MNFESNEKKKIFCDKIILTYHPDIANDNFGTVVCCWISNVVWHLYDSASHVSDLKLLDIIVPNIEHIDLSSHRMTRSQCFQRCDSLQSKMHLWIECMYVCSWCIDIQKGSILSIKHYAIATYWNFYRLHQLIPILTNKVFVMILLHKGLITCCVVIQKRGAQWA